MMTSKIINDSNQILHRLYLGEEIWVGPTTGQETIAEAGDLFTGWIDPDYKKWGTNKSSGRTTVSTLSAVYEMHRDAKFREMFGSLGNIDDLCWEQGQIINFCREHRDKLHPKGWATFFPFKVDGKKVPFVAGVRLVAGELEADVRRFGGGGVWGSEVRRRVVVPQKLGMVALL